MLSGIFDAFLKEIITDYLIMIESVFPGIFQIDRKHVNKHHKCKRVGENNMVSIGQRNRGKNDRLVKIMPQRMLGIDRDQNQVWLIFAGCAQVPHQVLIGIAGDCRKDDIDITMIMVCRRDICLYQIAEDIGFKAQTDV